MRLFIALNLNKKERQRIIRAARPLRDEDLPVRWVEEENCFCRRRSRCVCRFVNSPLLIS